MSLSYFLWLLVGLVVYSTLFYLGCVSSLWLLLVLCCTQLQYTGQFVVLQILCGAVCRTSSQYIQSYLFWTLFPLLLHVFPSSWLICNSLASILLYCTLLWQCLCWRWNIWAVVVVKAAFWRQMSVIRFILACFDTEFLCQRVNKTTPELLQLSACNSRVRRYPGC